MLPDFSANTYFELATILLKEAFKALSELQVTLNTRLCEPVTHSISMLSAKAWFIAKE